MLAWHNEDENTLDIDRRVLILGHTVETSRMSSFVGHSNGMVYTMFSYWIHSPVLLDLRLLWSCCHTDDEWCSGKKY